MTIPLVCIKRLIHMLCHIISGATRGPALTAALSLVTHPVWRRGLRKQPQARSRTVCVFASLLQAVQNAHGPCCTPFAGARCAPTLFVVPPACNTAGLSLHVYVSLPAAAAPCVLRCAPAATRWFPAQNATRRRVAGSSSCSRVPPLAATRKAPGHHAPIRL